MRYLYSLCLGRGRDESRQFYAYWLIAINAL